MIRIKETFFIAAIFAAFLLGASGASAQTSKTVEPSFDVVLQTIVASNEAGAKADVSPALAAVVRKLKTEFAFSNYQLNSTYIQRISNRGNAESKSVNYKSDATNNLPVFSEWSISGVESLLDERGQEMIQIRNFRFGQRVPVTSAGSTVNYEAVGLNTIFSLTKNTPTIVGSVATSKSDELMFVILTVKPAEK